MGGVCGTYGEESNAYRVAVGKLETGHLKNQGVKIRIIIK
jgi:hypothetical protein